MAEQLLGRKCADEVLDSSEKEFEESLWLIDHGVDNESLDNFVLNAVLKVLAHDEVVEQALIALPFDRLVLALERPDNAQEVLADFWDAGEIASEATNLDAHSIGLVVNTDLHFLRLALVRLAASPIFVIIIDVLDEAGVKAAELAPVFVDLQIHGSVVLDDPGHLTCDR